MKIIRISGSGIEEKISDPKNYAFFKRLADSNYIEWRPAFKHWMEKSGGIGWNYNLLGYIRRGDTLTPNYAYILKFLAKVNEEKEYLSLVIELAANGRVLATWKTDNNDFIKSSGFNSFLDQKAKVGEIIMLHDQVDELNRQKKIQESIEVARTESINEQLNRRARLTRRAFEKAEARAIDVIARPKPFFGGNEIGYQITYLESGRSEPFKIWKDSNPDGTAINKVQANNLFDDFIVSLYGVRFVNESSPDYIPPYANDRNWDFAWNKPINKEETVIDQTKDISKDEVVANTMKFTKESQANYNYEGFFSGDIPDYAVNYLGSPSVEASQIKSMFGRAGDSIDLVNQFDSSLLSDITFIFNFGKSGAYGVYLSELDRAIKTKALQKKLEQKGYKIELTEKGLTAFPKDGENITNEQVQHDIDSIHQNLQTKGGSAIGVNMSSVLSASKDDATSSGSKDPNIWEWMAMLHLGGTIVHEAVHAKGSRDEGGPEAAEAAFSQWALPKINEKYKQSLVAQGKEEEYSPITITPNKRHAAKSSWYKQAQMSYYIPDTCQAPSLGSDLKGRFPYDQNSNEGLADWSQIAQYYQNAAIESRLGRQFMSPLPKDLDQEHDSIEEQLRKYTREYKKLDTKATISELLSEGYDKNRGYETLEGLLDEKRPKPLIVPITKSASAIQKTATLFGWMNNLDLDDGSTIPGLGDRVMAWEDRDEDFAGEEEWIRKQPRYNPEYDLKGFYYRWIEPRFRPQLFDDMTQEYSNTTPAKRFASHDPIHGEWSKILSILAKAKQGVVSKGLSTRFIVSEDVMPLIGYIFRGEDVKVHAFEIKDSPESEKLFAVWITCIDIDEEKVEKSEKHIQKIELSEEADSVLDILFGSGTAKKSLIEEIAKQVKSLCEEYGFENILQIEENPNYICFKGGWGNQCFVIGSALAEKLNINDVAADSKNMSLAFNYKGIKVVFKNV